MKWKQTKRQNLAWQYLNDDITTELIFGGGAGGGKSRLGVSWEIVMCGKYPGSRWLLGRSKLKTLKETTLATFFDVCKDWGIQAGTHFKYNGQSEVITWSNGSQIVLKDLFLYPSDPNFDSLGSLEITGGFIDEVNQITFKAWEVAGSRIRYKLDEFGITPKLLGTCNPAKNWVYPEFYKPSKEGRLPDHRKFVQALAKDNPFLPSSYLDRLRSIKDNATRERLLMGNWEYDDDPSALFSYDVIQDLFSNKALDTETKYLVGDVARKGRDRYVLSYWEGLQAKKFYELPYEIKSDTTKAITYIVGMLENLGIRKSNCILDEDGVGGGCVDGVGCKGFINGSSAIQPTESKWDDTKRVNFINLKSQCAHKAAELAEKGEVGIDPMALDTDQKDLLVEELEQIKRRDADKDGKVAITRKEDIKENIGRSPDFADNIIMRMYFELNNGHEPDIQFL